MAAMLFSVVVPAHNAASFIGAQLEALASQVDPGPFEVIVVDNVSTDGTRDVVAQYSSQVELNVVTATGARSASHARNTGILHARGEVIVFVDADDVADANLLAAYRRCADRYAIMGGAYDENRLNDPRVAAWRYRLTQSGLPVAFQTVPFFLMGNAAIHRSVFDAIGAFDELLTHGGEEVDFAVRAQLAGYEIGWVPDAIVFYRHRTTLGALARQFFDYGRAATYVYARYRNRAALRKPTVGESIRTLGGVLLRSINLMRGNARRGDWVRVASFYAGEAIESCRQRVWHLG